MMSSAPDTGTTEPCPRCSCLEWQLQQQAVELFNAGLSVHHPYYCVFNPDTGYEKLLQQDDDCNFGLDLSSLDKFSSSTASEDSEFGNQSDRDNSHLALQPVYAQRFSPPDSLRLTRLALARLTPAPPTQLHIHVRAWLSGETKYFVQSIQTRSTIFHLRDEINAAFEKPLGTPLRIFLGDTCQKLLPICHYHCRLIDFLPNYQRSTNVFLCVVWLATHDEPASDDDKLLVGIIVRR